VPLQGQPFQVCAILLENSGKLVMREELRRPSLPEDTFVDLTTPSTTDALPKDSPESRWETEAETPDL